MDTFRHDELTIQGNKVTIDTYKGTASGYLTIIAFPDGEEPMMRTSGTEAEANTAHDEGIRLAKQVQSEHGA